MHFNSQPHEEADEEIPYSKFVVKDFNSQPHEEADEIVHYNLARLMYFNSQPHEEADGSNRCKPVQVSVFQLTASRGG